MFTGLIETTAVLALNRPQGRGRMIELALSAAGVERLGRPAGAPPGPVGGSAADLSRGVALGDSVAVNGVCLTVTRIGRARLAFDAVGDTLEKTTLAAWAPGRVLNLERALSFGKPVGGHLVSGHVGGIGRVRRWEARHPGWSLLVEAPAPILARCQAEGSIAIDGISLTIAAVEGDCLRVSVIPHTRSHSSLQNLRLGQAVNLEADQLGTWLGSGPENHESTQSTDKQGLSRERLAAWGY